MSNDGSIWKYRYCVFGRASETIDLTEFDKGIIEKGELRFVIRSETEVEMIKKKGGWYSNFFEISPEYYSFELFNRFVGSIKLPEKMTYEEAYEWLEDNPEEKQKFCENELKSSITAEEYIDGSIR